MSENNEANKPVVEEKQDSQIESEVKTEDVLYPDKDVKVEDKPEVKTEEKIESKEEPSKESKDVPPDDSEIKLAVAEGSSLTDEDVNEVKEFAKANKLSQESAQKLLDERSKIMSKVAEKSNADFKAKTESWLNEIKQIKTFDEDLKATQQVLADYFDPEFKKMLNESGLGNHPALFKGFAKLGKAMMSKPLVQAPRNAAAKKLEDWEVFYGPDEKSG
jgi:hypothetical protein